MDISIPNGVRELLVESPPTPSFVDSESMLLVHSGFYEDNQGAFYSLEDGSPVEAELVDRNSPVLERRVTRCPHAGTAARMSARIMKMRESRDSCGGTITCVITNLPAGLGEPVFDKFHAAMSQSMISIPAVKGFEVGSGFAGSRTMTGSQHNDPILSFDPDKNAVFGSNHAGGVLGGVTSGQNFYFRIALKPVSSIGQTQETCDFDGNKTNLTLTGRHDPCVLPRAVQIVESMAAITVMDFILRQKIRG
jgi:chorismate synthase